MSNTIAAECSRRGGPAGLWVLCSDNGGEICQQLLGTGMASLLSEDLCLLSTGEKQHGMGVSIIFCLFESQLKRLSDFLADHKQDAARVVILSCPLPAPGNKF